VSDDLGGRRDPTSDHSKELLLGHIRAVLDYREQVREINADKAERKKTAKDQGFDPVKIEEVARWVEKVNKHGRDVMDEAEAIYDLYRSVHDGQGQDFDTLMDGARDRALLKIFAPEDQTSPKGPTKRQKAIADALAGAAIGGSQANRMIRR